MVLYIIFWFEYEEISIFANLDFIAGGIISQCLELVLLQEIKWLINSGIDGKMFALYLLAHSLIKKTLQNVVMYQLLSFWRVAWYNVQT